MDRLFRDSLSRNGAFKCLMFMPEISNWMVFVNGKHPGFPTQLRAAFLLFVLARTRASRRHSPLFNFLLPYYCVDFEYLGVCK